MKFLIPLIVMIIWLPSSQAASSSITNDVSSHTVYASLGFWNGGFSFGGDYEHPSHRTFGVGGQIRYYSKDNDRGMPSLFVVGGFVRPHFNRRQWDFYVSPGFNLMMIDGNNTDETVLGPSLTLGLLYQIKRNMAVGMDQTNLVGWFNDDYRGQILQDLMMKLRLSF